MPTTGCSSPSWASGPARSTGSSRLATADRLNDLTVRPHVVFQRILGDCMGGRFPLGPSGPRPSSTSTGCGPRPGTSNPSCPSPAGRGRRGHFREALRLAEEGFRFVERASEAGAKLGYMPADAAAYAMALGQSDDAEVYLAEAVHILERTPGAPMRTCEFLSYRLFLALEQGEVGSAADELVAAFRAQLGRVSPSSLIFYLRTFYVLNGYLAAARWAQAPDDERDAHVPPLAAALRELQRVAREPQLVAHAVCLQALLAIARGAYADAAPLDRAASLAHRLDMPWVTFEVLRNRARAARSQGEVAVAQRCAYMAADLAAREGWAQRRDQVARELGLPMQSLQSWGGTMTRRGSSSRASSPARESAATVVVATTPEGRG